MIAKTDEERALLRESGRRAAKILKALGEMVQPGTTPKDIDARAWELLKADGDKAAFYDYESGKKGEKFPSALCVSVNDVIVHAPASLNSTPFEQGDVVKLDFGVNHKGYFSDHAITVIAGDEQDPKDREMIRAAHEALDAAIAAARIGNTTGDIGEAVERIATKYGYGYPKNLSGHGVGKEVHEEPHVPNYRDAHHDEPLKEGMVLALEPMFTRGSGAVFVDSDNFSYRTRDGSRTAHVEHTVLITRDGPEILTKV